MALCIPAGKRKVTIEEIREALRKACAEARGRDPEGTEVAEASAEAAPVATKGRKRQQKVPAGGAKPKKATPARKAGPCVVTLYAPADMMARAPGRHGVLVYMWR